MVELILTIGLISYTIVLIGVVGIILWRLYDSDKRRSKQIYYRD